MSGDQSSEKLLKRPRVGLVLSGGGARGAAQIGVLKAMEEAKIPIDFIAATSMGAIIGGLYASGYSVAEIESIAYNTDWDELLSLSDEAKRSDLALDQKLAADWSFVVVRFDGLQPVLPHAVSNGQRLTNFLSEKSLQALYHPNPSFDHLKIPFRAVTTDLISGKRIVLASGSLASALRATSTVPLLFNPVEKDSMQLIDGGLVTNIPVDVAKDAGCDLVIAVNSTSGLRIADELKAPWQTADQIMGIMMQRSNEEQLKLADIVITPDIGRHLSSDFSGLDSLIAKGYRAAQERVDSLRTLIIKAGLSSTSLAYDAAPRLADAPMLLHVEFSGNRVVSSDSLKLALTGVLHQPLTRKQYTAVVEGVLRKYRTRGYSLARIVQSVFDTASGTLHLALNEGVIETIRFHGGTRTESSFLMREFDVEEGEVFDIARVQRGLNNISSTNLFEYVYLETEYRDQKPHLTIRFAELPSQLIRIGIRADDERNLQGRADVRDENFRGLGTELGLTISGGARNAIANLEFRSNRLFSQVFTFSIAAFTSFYDTYLYADDPTETRQNRWRRAQVGEYSDIRYGMRIATGAQFEKLGNATIEYSLQSSRIANIRNATGLQERHLLSMISLGTVIDSRSTVPFPTFGVNMKLSYEFASTRLGSTIGYTALRFFWEWFTTWGRSTLHPKVALGFGDATMPLAQQFRLGGRETMFGTREDDRRGRQLFAASLEYRFHLPVRIVFDSYFRVRYDLATISALPTQIKFSTFRHGVGAELAFNTPVGQTALGIGNSFYFDQGIRQNSIKRGPLLIYFTLGYELHDF
jgi:NTE family protein